MSKILLSIIIFVFFSITLIGKNRIIENESELEVIISQFDQNYNNQWDVIFAIDEFDPDRFDISIYESASISESKNYSSSHEYRFEYVGIERGVKLARLEIDLNRTNPLDNKSYKVDSVHFIYKFKNPISINDNYRSKFNPLILNKKQLFSLTTNNKFNKTNKIQSNQNWFNPNLKYYKFYSTKDGIARLNLSELIKKDNSLVGKSVNNLSIKNRGNEVKYYPTTNVIQHDEFLYFVVSHPHGDTSYYDYYNGKEPYFVTYDLESNTNHYDLISDLNTNNMLESVTINRHYEEDRVYGNGVDVTDTETVLSENWYFSDVRVPNDFNIPWEYFTEFTLFPSSDLRIEYEYASNIYFLPETVYNKTLTRINNQSYDTISNVGSKVITTEIVVPNNELLQGGNTFNFNSYKVVEDIYKSVNNGIIGFDYYNITGEVIPIAENNYFSFLNDNKSDSKVNVSCFKDNFVVVIDTTNNTIQFPKIESIDFLALSVKNKFSSIFLNKQLAINRKYGFSIVSRLGTENIVRFFESESEFLTYLDNIESSNTALVISLNSDLSNNLKTKISIKFGSSLINSAKDKFIFANYKSKKYESTAENILEKIGNGDYYSAEVLLPKGVKSRKIVNSLSSIQEMEIVDSKLELVEEKEVDAFYIYNPVFEPTINKYTSYISGAEGKKILPIDLEQLYDTYGYGIESPHSIKKFLNYAYENWEKFPEFLTLVGDATWDPKKQREGSFVDQLIPVYGIPYSDNFYGTLEGNDYIPEIVIGRIPVNNNQELENYFEKIRTYYEVPVNPWMKSILQIAGGDDGQKFGFAQNMHDLNIYFNSTNICPDTTTISKTSNETVSESQANEIKKEINKGKIWTNFLGHGSPTVIDMSGWEAPNLNNQGKYGFLNTLSCNTSAFAEPWQFNSIGEEFVNIKNKGFVGVIGGTSTTQVHVALSVSYSMYFALINEQFPERSIGKIYNSYKARNPKAISALNQVVLLGDPLISVRIATKPEIVLYEKNVEITDQLGNEIITENDTKVRVDYTLYNIGTVNKDSMNVRIIHTFNSKSDTIIKRIEPVCFESKHFIEFDLNRSIGKHNISIFADYDSLINDVNYVNNEVNMSFDVFSQGLIPIEPLDNWNVSAQKAIFRFVNPTGTEKEYNFKLKNAKYEDIFSDIKLNLLENYIELEIENLDVNTDYILQYSSKEKLTGVESSVKYLEFHTSDKIDSIVHYSVKSNSRNLEYENLKETESGLEFDDKEFSVFLSSARGSENAERHAIINTIDEENGSLFSYLNRLQRGFNIIIIPDIIDDTTFISKHFDTWDSKFKDDDIFYDSRWLDRFLTDSLPYGHYLLLATADVSTRAPDIIDSEQSPESVGSITRIKNSLKDLGSKFADSLQFNSSFVMFTRIGFPESTIDYHLLGDTIQLTTEFTRFQTNARVLIENVGKSKKFISSNINYTGDNISTDTKFNSNGATILNSNKNITDMSEIDCNENPSLNLDMIFKRDSVGSPFSFNFVKIDFVPTPELAVIKSESKLNKDNYERGETAEFTYKVENISTRSIAENIEFEFTIENNFNPIKKNKNIPLLATDTSLNTLIDFNTTEFATENMLFSQIDPKSQLNELFTFNNILRADIKIDEDTTKPWLIAYADGVELSDKSFVSERPIFSVELYDKSTLEVLKENVIFNRINRKVMLNNNVDTFNFELINQGDLKARVTFRPTEKLDIGQNILNVIGEDATGNHADTLNIDLIVSNDYFTNELINYPNPFDENTSFKYNYVGKENNIKVRVTIYNALGSEIKTIESNANFGENKIDWDGLDSFGNSVSSGIYYYKLVIVNKSSEPSFNRMIKVN